MLPKHNIEFDFINFVHCMVLQVHVVWSWLTLLVALESSCFSQNYLTMLDSITFSFLIASSVQSCLLFCCSSGVKSGVMKVLVTCGGCSIALLLRFHRLRRMVSVSSLEESDTLISLHGFITLFPIRIALVIEADTPMYWLNKLVRFWMSSFFLACASVKFDSGTLYVQSDFVSSFPVLFLPIWCQQSSKQ